MTYWYPARKNSEDLADVQKKYDLFLILLTSAISFFEYILCKQQYYVRLFQSLKINHLYILRYSTFNFYDVIKMKS